MNTELSSASQFYMALIDDEPAACFAIIHFPHPNEKKFKRGHRLVVMPDYQGFGLGHTLSSEIAQIYKDQGYRFIITSNTKSLYKQRLRDARWRVTSVGRSHSLDRRKSRSQLTLNNTGSHNKITISYEYVGQP